MIKLLLALGILYLLSNAYAFCGFYVAKANTELFNESSKVIIARANQRTILTMANNFKGDVSEFALVVPIPYVFKENQIQVGHSTIFDRLDAYSAPRLVEYFDHDPCAPPGPVGPIGPAGAPSRSGAPGPASISCWDTNRNGRNDSFEDRNGDGHWDLLDCQNSDLKVTIEEEFSVGEYDILILSAEESQGLETWLIQNDYQIPEGASKVLAPYIETGMNFFVAKVNLEEFEESDYQYLRPLMMAFESDELTLPIQLGMLNATGTQDLLLFLLSPEGRIELNNYPVTKIPTNINIPKFVEDEFDDFYLSMFVNSYEQEATGAFLEYAWDMFWCDPCATNPLSFQELKRSGVFWINERNNFQPSKPNSVYLTRLHLRYSKETHSEDLKFKVTNNRRNFQGRYVIKRAFKGEITCEAGLDYIEKVKTRHEIEAKRLANLTSWNISDITAKIGEFNPIVNIPHLNDDWWETVFKSLSE